jgi:hypothetical protein
LHRGRDDETRPLPKETPMIGFPHPYTMTVLKEQWRAEMLAEADRERRARLAERGNRDPRPIPALGALLAAAIVVALLLAVGVATARELATETAALLAGREARDASQVVETRLLDPSAVQTIGAGRL